MESSEPIPDVSKASEKRLAKHDELADATPGNSIEAEDEHTWALLSELQAHNIGLAGIDKYCGNEAKPGGEDPPGWREWTAIETTSDQRRIEDWLLTRPTDGRRILHIGVGNSSLAKRLSERLDGRGAEIVGTTIYTRETEFAESLHLKNYSVHVLNKYSFGMRELPGKFDFIIDNNPSSYTCCLFHFCRMLRSYRSLLKPGGEWLTAEPGLGMVLPGRDPHWALDWEQWASLARILGLHAVTRTPMVYAMVNAPAPDAAPASSPASATPAPGARTLSQALPQALSQAARARLPALAAQLDGLLDELAQTQESFAALLRTRASAQQQLAGLFTLPRTDAPRPLAPYEEISPGIRIGFEQDMPVTLAVEPKPDEEASPAQFHNRLRLSLGGRGWFSVEIHVPAAEFIGTSACQLSFCTQPNRPISCNAMLRWLQNGRYHDQPLLNFTLNPQEHNYNFTCRFPPIANDPALPVEDGLVVALFEVGPDAELELDYASLYFA